VYAERADDQEAAEHGRRGRFGLRGFLDGHQLYGRARVVVGHPAGHLSLLPETVQAGLAACRLLLLDVFHASVRTVGVAVHVVLLLFVVRVTAVTSREPVHQFLDGEHEEEPGAHDELGEQLGDKPAFVQRAVVGQPLDALPDLGQQVQERGAQQHAAAEVQHQPEHGVRGAAGLPPDAEPLEHAHGRAADHE